MIRAKLQLALAFSSEFGESDQKDFFREGSDKKKEVPIHCAVTLLWRLERRNAWLLDRYNTQ